VRWRASIEACAGNRCLGIGDAVTEALDDADSCIGRWDSRGKFLVEGNSLVALLTAARSKLRLLSQAVAPLLQSGFVHGGAKQSRGCNYSISFRQALLWVS